MHHLRRLRTKVICAAVFTLAVSVFPSDVQAQTVQYFPQLADGGEYVTQWQFTGLGIGASVVTLELFQPDGSPLTLPTDRGTAPSYTFNLGATERTSVRTLGTGATIRVGSARVTSNRPIGVTEVFQRVRGGTILGQAGVLASEPRRLATLFVSNNGAGQNTGIAIVNTNSSPISVNLTLQNQAGTPMQTILFSLPARGQLARFFDELFGSVGVFEGTVSISSMSRFSVVALLLDGEQLSTLPTLPGRLIGVNLIKNGHAEDGAGATAAEAVPLPGWSSTGGPTVLRYGTSNYPSPASPGPTERGSNFFAGGPNTGLSTAVQVIDLSALATFIDADLLTCSAAGYFGGFGTQDDSAYLEVHFMDITGNYRGSCSVGGTNADDRQNVTGLLFLSRVDVPVPPGSRSALVTLRMIRLSGQFNDGYADNLSLILSERMRP